MGNTDPRVWGAIVAQLRETEPAVCRRWFDELEPLELSEGA